MSAMGRRAKVVRFPGPPPREPRPGWVEVHRCRDQAEAVVVRGLLESEGIAAALRSNLAQSVYPFSVGDQAEVTVLVPREEAVRARAVLSRRAS